VADAWMPMQRRTSQSGVNNQAEHCRLPQPVGRIPTAAVEVIMCRTALRPLPSDGPGASSTLSILNARLPIAASERMVPIDLDRARSEIPAKLAYCRLASSCFLPRRQVNLRTTPTVCTRR
jgi:hypothetical protein